MKGFPNEQSVFGLILDVSRYVNQHILRNYAQVQERMSEIMGGKIIEGLPSVKIFEDGKAEGLAEGKAEKSAELLSALIRNLRKEDPALSEEAARNRAKVLLSE